MRRGCNQFRTDCTLVVGINSPHKVSVPSRWRRKEFAFENHPQITESWAVQVHKEMESAAGYSMVTVRLNELLVDASSPGLSSVDNQSRDPIFTYV